MKFTEKLEEMIFSGYELVADKDKVQLNDLIFFGFHAETPIVSRHLYTDWDVGVLKEKLKGCPVKVWRVKRNEVQ